MDESFSGSAEAPHGVLRPSSWSEFPGSSSLSEVFESSNCTSMMTDSLCLAPPCFFAVSHVSHNKYRGGCPSIHDLPIDYSPRRAQHSNNIPEKISIWAKVEARGTAASCFASLNSRKLHGRSRRPLSKFRVSRTYRS